MTGELTKGFASKEKRKYLRRERLADLVQHRGHHRTPLSAFQSAINKLIGTVRYKVEQCFESMKQRFHLDRARYFGRRRVEAQVNWAEIQFNLLKAHHKLARLKIQPVAA